MNVNEALCAYLKENDFTEFMACWRIQYERLGQCGGTITVPLHEANRDAISGFMGKNYHQGDARIAYPALKKAIDESRFAGADFNEVLQLYFNQSVITHKHVKAQKAEYIEAFFCKYLDAWEASKAFDWLQDIYQSHNKVYIRLSQAYLQDAAHCQVVLTQVLNAVDALPMWDHKQCNMAIFAGRVTGDPHAFDKATFAYYLLFQAICYYLKQKDVCNGIAQNDILYQAGLYRDGISNFCYLYHLQANDRQGELHSGWQGFYEHHEIMNINMENLSAIDDIQYNTSPIVCIVENPSIFQALVEKARFNNYQGLGFICTNGQVNAAGYLLMDKLKHAHITMCYSGDMDPEGLLIADRLKLRYGNLLKLWRYRLEDFHKAKSQNYLSKARITMLDRIVDYQLRMIGDELKKEPVAYQENLVQEYLMDLETLERGEFPASFVTADHDRGME